MTHEREVHIQAALVVDKGGITDAVRLDPIANVLTQLDVASLGAIELI